MESKSTIAQTAANSGGGATTQLLRGVQKVGLLAGRYRWVVCGLLFLGVTKNYMDRQVLSVLKVPLQHAYGWSEVDYGNLVSVFQAAYAVGMLAMGRVIDRLGTRAGYAFAVTFWSIAS